MSHTTVVILTDLNDLQQVKLYFHMVEGMFASPVLTGKRSGFESYVLSHNKMKCAKEWKKENGRRGLCLLKLQVDPNHLGLPLATDMILPDVCPPLVK